MVFLKEFFNFEIKSADDNSMKNFPGGQRDLGKCAFIWLNIDNCFLFHFQEKQTVLSFGTVRQGELMVDRKGNYSGISMLSVIASLTVRTSLNLP